MDVESIHSITGIDPWFLASIEELVQFESKLRQIRSLEEASDELMRLGEAEWLLRPATGHTVGDHRG